MNSSAQYQKLPAVAKAILDNFESGRSRKTKLFSDINKNILTQTTVKSKSVRRSIFRGLLRNHFNMSDADMKKIEPSDDAKQAYFESNEEGLENQTESIYTKAVIRRLMTKEIL